MSDQRNDDQGPVRPQVIDLEAEEIRTEAEAPRAAEEPGAASDDTQSSAGYPPPPKPQQRGRSGTAAWIVAALILGAIGGGWLYRDVLAGYFPSNQMRALQTRLATLETSSGGLSAELAALKQAADAASKAAAAAAEGANAARLDASAAMAEASGLRPRVDENGQRLAAAEDALKTAGANLAALRNAVSSAPAGTAGAAPGPADTAALTALAQRIDALEKDVASLKSSASATATGEGGQASVTSALSQALSDLKAKVAAGAPFAEEHERIARMVPAAAGLETVGARAAEGLPNAQGLTEELRAAIPALPQPAAPAAQDDSYLGSLMKSLSGVITIRPIGETDWPGVAERAATFAEAGDLNQAIAVIDGAEGEKPMALTQWRDRAAARLQLEAALAEVSDAVLRQITALGGNAQ